MISGGKQDKTGLAEVFGKNAFHFCPTRCKRTLLREYEMYREGGDSMSGPLRYTLAGILIGVLVALSGCSDSNEYNPISVQYLNPPIVTGMILTDAMGNPTGAWGNPTSTLEVYPNPTDGPVVISLWVEDACRLRVWIVKAYGPGESFTPLVSFAGGEVYAGYGAPVRILFDDEVSGGRGFGFFWNSADDSGNALPSGFYRIYVMVDRSIYWGDMFLARECAEIPAYINWPGCD